MKLVLLLSTLVALLWLELLVVLLSAMAGWAIGTCAKPRPWLESELPVDYLDDPDYDSAYDGWWCEDYWTEDDGGLVYRTFEGRVQFLLTYEQIYSQDLRVWWILHDARL